ncbi:DUF4232 domain-containing protein [Dyella sp.]|uniref:DUF4232 domain-containing protein n=1 Tax=Dyella sp. TaxID=1869338 RepID=UPI002ED1F7E0
MTFAKKLHMPLILMGGVLLGFTSMAHAQGTPVCGARQVTLSTSDGEGMNGMSHAGTVLKLDNHSRTACSLPAMPRLVFEDARHRTLKITSRAIPGMHPGPVMLPLTVLAHGSVSSEVQWVSGDVYDHSACITPAYVTLQLDNQELRAPFHGGRMCGPQDQGPTYQAGAFRRLP